MPIGRKEEVFKSSKENLENGETEELIELSTRFDLIYINGKYFKEISRNGKVFWKKVPIEEIEELENKAEEVAEKLLEHLDRKKVLVEALRKIHPDDLNTVHRMLFEDKKNYKIKTRENHCVDMKIGNFILPIIDLV